MAVGEEVQLAQPTQWIHSVESGRSAPDHLGKELVGRLCWLAAHAAESGPDMT